MNKMTFIWVLSSLIVSSGCQNRTGKAKDNSAVKPEETYEYFIAPVGPDNPRNSEAAIVPLKDGTLLLGWTEF
jgi:hypothetical protein